MKKWLPAIFVLISLLIVLVIDLAFQPTQVQETAGWIMAYFTENPDNYDLHLAYSTDGLHWTELNGGNPVAHPTLGYQGLRDPFILRKQDGTFVVLATNMYGTNFGQTSPAIHVWDSTDLITFSNYRLVRMTATNMHAWAPEAFWDESRGEYGIIWSGNTDRNRIYVNYTTDFVNVGTEQVYFDPGVSVLDANVIPGSPMNYLYFKSEPTNSLYGCRSTLLAPGSFDDSIYTGALLQGNLIEAPELVPAGDTWYLYGDSYAPINGVIYAWQTSDIDANAWTALSRAIYTPPPAAKHPGIVPVTAGQLAKIVAYWNGGDATSLSSTPQPPRQGPVVWYRFNEHRGTVTADASGGGWHGSLINGASWVDGTIGNAVDLDGFDDYVIVPRGVVSNLDDFSIATWVRLDAISSRARVFDFGTGTSVNMFLTPQDGAANTVRFAITTGGDGGEQQIVGSSALPTGGWTHVAVTKSGNTGSLYVDGALVGTNGNMTLSPLSLGNTDQNWIGRSQYSADPYLDGQVDDFRIYNRALSASEVSDLAD